MENVIITGEVVKLNKSGSKVYVHTTIGHFDIDRFPTKNIKVGEKIMMENVGDGWNIKFK